MSLPAPAPMETSASVTATHAHVQVFEETMAEDEAALQAQLEQLQKQQQAKQPKPADEKDKEPRKPRREHHPEHLRREDHLNDPQDTNCPSPDCGRPMRVGEDISEKLDIVPAEFFAQRHIYGKWACRCCQCLVQEPAVPQIIDGGIMATGLIAHTVTSHFVDHLPYYRLETINARSGVHTPRSTLAQTGGRVGAAMEPLYDAHRRLVLQSRVLHADETPVAMLDPGRGKTKRAYVWTCAKGVFNSIPGVVYKFCLGRGAQYPIAFLRGDDGLGAPAPWSGTLVRDEYSAYKQVVDSHCGRIAAGCLAHARRRFHELAKAGTSDVGQRGDAAHRGDPPCRARARQPCQRRAPAHAPGGDPADVGGTASVVAPGALPRARWRGDSQGVELQPERLGCADAQLGR